jgi:hypothetical protein
VSWRTLQATVPGHWLRAAYCMAGHWEMQGRNLAAGYLRLS